MITGARTYLDVPAVTPLGGGVLATARVVESSDPHDLMGTQYLTDACAEAYTWLEFCTLAGVQCPTYVPPSTGTKQFDDAPDVVEGEPFAVYSGISCDFQKLEEGKARAQQRLRYTEGRSVDAAVLEWLAAQATDALSGGPFGIAEGIGILENYAANVYGGVPIIVMPRHITACACAERAIYNSLDGSLATCQGSPVANVTAPTVSTPTAIYAIGQITLVRGPVQSYSVPSQNLCDGTVSPPRALAERIYVPLIECLAATVEVTCP